MTTLDAVTDVSNKPCPICLHPVTHSPSDNEYIRCQKCGVVRTKYSYDSFQYNSHYAHRYIQYAKSPVNQSLQLFRLGLVSRWLNEDSHILDIGCGIGEFIRFAESYYQCTGFEPNGFASKEASRRVKRSPIYTSINGWHLLYDCITMFDVLEHIEFPTEFLIGCSNILKPNGIIALTTPNVEAIEKWDDIGLRKWKHYKPEEHLFLYTEDSLQVLFWNLGFDVVHWGREESDIRPENPNGDILTCVARKK